MFSLKYNFTIIYQKSEPMNLETLWILEKVMYFLWKINNLKIDLVETWQVILLRQNTIVLIVDLIRL